MSSPEAGWYSDPLGDMTKLRYWDGLRWTEKYRDAPEFESIAQQSVANYAESAPTQPPLAAQDPFARQQTVATQPTPHTIPTAGGPTGFDKQIPAPTPSKRQGISMGLIIAILLSLAFFTFLVTILPMFSPSPWRNPPRSTTSSLNDLRSYSNPPVIPNFGESSGQSNEDLSEVPYALVDNRQAVNSYQISDELYEHSGVEIIAALNNTECEIAFYVEYPQLRGLSADIEEKVNLEIQNQAMHNVNRMYLNPTDEFKDTLIRLLENENFSGLVADLQSTVHAYVTYNDDRLISIAFEDHFFLGTVYAEYNDVRTVTIDIETGEVYRGFQSIATADEDLALTWQTRAKELAPDSAFIENQPLEDYPGILSNSESTGRYLTSFYLTDANTINVAVTYHMSLNGTIARGWIAVSFTAEELARCKNESGFWRFF